MCTVSVVGPFERRQAADDRLQLHAVVRRGGITAGQLDLLDDRAVGPARDEDRRPAAGAGVAGAGAVGPELDRVRPRRQTVGARADGVRRGECLRASTSPCSPRACVSLAAIAAGIYFLSSPDCNGGGICSQSVAIVVGVPLILLGLGALAGAAFTYWADSRYGAPIACIVWACVLLAFAGAIGGAANPIGILLADGGDRHGRAERLGHRLKRARTPRSPAHSAGRRKPVSAKATGTSAAAPRGAAKPAQPESGSSSSPATRDAGQQDDRVAEPAPLERHGEQAAASAGAARRASPRRRRRARCPRPRCPADRRARRARRR